MSELGSCKERRPAYWSEMSDSTKVEELKKELQRTQHQVKYLCGFVKVLLCHEHVGDRLVHPIDNNSCEEDGGSLYFRAHEFK